jgi:hypothetical protein
MLGMPRRSAGTIFVLPAGALVGVRCGGCPGGPQASLDWRYRFTGHVVVLPPPLRNVRHPRAANTTAAAQRAAADLVDAACASENSPLPAVCNSGASDGAAAKLRPLVVLAAADACLGQCVMQRHMMQVGGRRGVWAVAVAPAALGGGVGAVVLAMTMATATSYLRVYPYPTADSRYEVLQP